MLFLRKIFNLETPDQKFERYLDAVNRIEGINSQISEMASEYTTKDMSMSELVKSGCSADIIKSAEQRFDNYKSNYLDRLMLVKREKDSAEKSLNKLEKDRDVIQHIRNRDMLKKAILNGSICPIKLTDIMKSKAGKEKFDHVMSEFASGKLKGADGKVITSREQALAVAYSESGLKESEGEVKKYKDNKKNRDAGRENLPYDKDNKILIAKAVKMWKDGNINDSTLKLIIEKARSGKYADTPENRRLKRVGHDYGSKKQDDDKEKDTKGTDDKKEAGGNEGGDLTEQAKSASVSQLEAAIKEGKTEEIRSAAHAELARREKEEKPKEDGEESKEKFDISEKEYPSGNIIVVGKEGGTRLRGILSKNGSEFTVKSTFVDESERGKGKAKEMYIQLLSALKDKGVKKVKSDVQVEEAAGKIYLSLKKDGYNVSQNKLAELEKDKTGNFWWCPEDDSKSPFEIDLTAENKIEKSEENETLKLLEKWL